MLLYEMFAIGIAVVLVVGLKKKGNSGALRARVRIQIIGVAPVDFGTHRRLINVRFAPLCGLKSDISRGPKSAVSRHMQRSKRWARLRGIFVDFIWRHGRCPCILDAITIIRAERGVSGLTDDFNAQPCRITRGTDDETDRSPACHGRKPCIRAKSFSRAKSHVAMYACL